MMGKQQSGYWADLASHCCNVIFILLAVDDRCVLSRVVMRKVVTRVGQRGRSRSQECRLTPELRVSETMKAGARSRAESVSVCDQS